jgi:aspartate carbamoyltransferase catalytic subunit
MTLRTRHLLSIDDLNAEEAVRVLDVAEEMANLSNREVKKLPALRGRTVLNLFLEDSTRTRLSFEAAAKRLSADVMTLTSKGSSVTKGETLKDTAVTLEAMGADVVVLRHSASGAAHRLANAGWVQASVVNAGDGTHEHPTQALLDAFSIRRRLHAGSGNLKGTRVGIVGDVLHAKLLKLLGAEPVLIAPPTLLPVGVASWGCQVSTDLDHLLPELDAVMMLRVQVERMTQAFFPSEREYRRLYGLDARRMATLPEHAIVLHPGPMNRGMEITAEVADSTRSTVVEQVKNGVSVRMAVLYLLAGGN